MPRLSADTRIDGWSLSSPSRLQAQKNPTRLLDGFSSRNMKSTLRPNRREGQQHAWNQTGKGRRVGDPQLEGVYFLRSVVRIALSRTATGEGAERQAGMGSSATRMPVF